MPIGTNCCANTVCVNFGPPMCDVGVTRQPQLSQLLPAHKNEALPPHHPVLLERETTVRACRGVSGMVQL